MKIGHIKKISYEECLELNLIPRNNKYRPIMYYSMNICRKEKTWSQMNDLMAHGPQGHYSCPKKGIFSL